MSPSRERRFPFGPVLPLILAALLAAAPAADSPAEALARRIEQRHRGLSDLQARFTQRYRSGLIGREVVERGTVSLKPPGRMLWLYQQPERKTFVSDGHRFYFYVPADKQVIVREQGGEQGVTGLLLGRSDILETFEASLETPARPEIQRLRLSPRKPDGEVDRVLLEVDLTARIRAIDVEDAQGNHSRFEFEGFQENQNLPDSLFRFEVPKGVEVVTG